MEIVNSLIDVFGLSPDSIVTFADLLIWFCKMVLGVECVLVAIKSMFAASWKLERMMR